MMNNFYTGVYWRMRCKKLERKNRNLEATLELRTAAAHEILDGGLEAVARYQKLEVEIATARNDALDEALAALNRVREPIAAIADKPWSGSAYRESFRLWQVRNLIEALKCDNS